MIIEIRVTSNCPKAKVEEFGEGLKVRVKAKPLEGKANKEVVALVAEHFGVPEENVRIIRGATSNRKVVEVL